MGILGRNDGWTIIEILSVCIIILIIASFALPSYMHARRAALEDNAIQRLNRIALAESRFYSDYERFGDFMELVDANLLPKGYSTKWEFRSPVTSASVLPFIDRYSLAFVTPNTPNSLYYQVIATPVGYNRMGLRTFNINKFITGSTYNDRLVAMPPVREGAEVNGLPVTIY